MAKKPSRIRRTFTPQFKKDAVTLVLGGRTVNAVAHDLGIARSLLQRWKIQLAREPDGSPRPPSPGPADSPLRRSRSASCSSGCGRLLSATS